MSYEARGNTIVLSGKPLTIDANIYSDHTADNSGAGDPNRAGENNMNTARRLLIRFDLSTVPSLVSIDSVALQMVVTNVPSGGTTVTHALFRLTNSWSEGTGIGTGSGGQIVNGGVTWSYRQYPILAWNSAGGDFVSSTSASTIVSTVVGSTTVWTGPGMTADVQGWVNGSLSNDGWIILGDETIPQTIRGYASSEDTSTPPVLTVYYTPANSVNEWRWFLQ